MFEEPSLVPMPMTVTLATLDSDDACGTSKEVFSRVFGDKADITPENILKLLEADRWAAYWLDWLACDCDTKRLADRETRDILSSICAGLNRVTEEGNKPKLEELAKQFVEVWSRLHLSGERVPVAEGGWRRRGE